MNNGSFTPPQVIFEDADLLVLNKAPGTIVNRSQSVKDRTLQDWIEERYKADPTWLADLQSDQEFAERSGMVHRLDKDTSGVLVFAKNAKAMHELMEQFQERETKKSYRALVHGHLPSQTGIIQAPIDRNPKNRQKFTVTSEGRPSETHFSVEEEFGQAVVPLLLEFLGPSSYPGIKQDILLYAAGFSLLRLSPKTGRTHQIRVHLDYLHHPIVGDVRYVGRKRARLDLQWCPRQWLHAESLEFTHPQTGETVQFVAPLPEDLERVIALLHGKPQSEN